MKKISLLLSAALVTHAAIAQIPVTSSSLLYTQDFNTLDTSATAPFSTNLPQGWTIIEGGTGSAADGAYRGGNGSANNGDTYSFGASGSTERALGSLSSGSVKPNYGAVFVNNTGSDITSITITYRAEQWRMGSSTTDTLRFYYSTSATGVDTVLTSFTPVPSLYATAINPLASQGALDGNDILNSVLLTGIINVTIPNNGTVVLQWSDQDAVGSDHGIGVDDLNILFTTSLAPTPGPSVIALSPADNATGVAPSSNLMMTFNKQIQKGSGNILVTNSTDQTTDTIDVTSSNVTISGSTVTISNIALMGNKSYYVMVDSTAFDTAGFRYEGIYDSTTWNFSTGANSVVSVKAKNALPVVVVGETSSSRINLAFSMNSNAQATIRIYDISGREVFSTTTVAGEGLNKVSVQPADLPSGLYLIQVSDGKESGLTKAWIH